MSHNIKAVLFDIGGVLANSTDQFIYTEICRVFGVNEKRAIEVVRMFEPQLQRNEITEHEFWRMISREFGVEPVPEQAWDLWFRVYERFFRVNEKTMELVRRLRSAGYKTGIISNTEKSHTEHKRKIGFFKGFEPVVLSCEVRHRKPGKEIFQIALDRLGLPGEQAAYTDDNEGKMEGARELGINCYCFDNADGLARWLRGLGVEF